MPNVSNKKPVVDEVVWIVVVSHPGKEHAVRSVVVRVRPVPIGIQMLVQRSDNKETIDFIVPNSEMTSIQDKLVPMANGDWRLSTLRSMRPYRPITEVNSLFALTPDNAGRSVGAAAHV